jgi:hypothetical protein
MVGLGGFGSTFGQEAVRTITINRDGKVGGQLLTKGDYTIKFVEGRDGEAVFMRGKREVARVSYEITSLKAVAADTLVVFKLADDGSLVISRIEFRGMGTALVIK